MLCCIQSCIFRAGLYSRKIAKRKQKLVLGQGLKVITETLAELRRVSYECLAFSGDQVPQTWNLQIIGLRCRRQWDPVKLQPACL